MYSFLGPHLHSAGGNWMQDVYRWKPPVVLSLDHATSVADLIKHSPSTLIVGRMPGVTPDFGEALDARAVARQHVDATLPQALRMGNSYTFWQCVANEPVIKTVDAMARYSDYSIHLMDMMAVEGFTAAIGHFSVGSPEFDLWRYYLPALYAAKAHGSVLCVHEYDWPSLANAARWPWLLLRHRLVHDGSQATMAKWGWPGLPDDLKSLPWIVTEAGLDSGVVFPGETFRGWRAAMPASDYAYQLSVYDAELAHDSYILGACLWDFGGGGQWATAEHWPELSELLANQAQPVYRFFENANGGDAVRWRQIADEVGAIRSLLAACCRKTT